MRIFVAGATGVVGRLLVPMLLESGHQVTGMSRSSGGADRVRRQGADAVQGDVLDRGSLREAVLAAAPDAIIHQLTDLAGADGEATNRLRVEGTRNLVDAARAAGTDRIVIQSVGFGYAPGDKPADETEPLDVGAEPPRRGLVDGIRAMEATASEVDTAVLLRFGILYGPGTWYAPGGAAAAVLSGDTGAPFLGSLVADQSVTSFLHVADAARAAREALGWPGGVVNIADDDPAEGREWVPVLAAALGVPAPRPTSGQLDWARGVSNSLARSRGWDLSYPTWRTGFATQMI
ncbi:nucleoside-diphosphate-sugar epimerase [Asanoa ferruginea]|uniref:Nucleoside-diphosphate-sugar epimerase n=1 Tax=Asanoa ferruginea TaxID=53367 RepID=A0A3D9ZS35_9ACTN|nr:NAD(P)-dependent oxidoreductase [Asanoa ferruginea]REG00042.1 nucleoside-diphosphate-sugar epimerase [Asanoa ferruginea]GIF46265.1 dTDP-glucose 4,6-dehydratase [Asanoa ferruginea]